MNVITIPRKLAQKDDLVIIPRKQYEEYLELKTEEVELTPAQKRALKQARQNLTRGKFLTINELKQKLRIVD